MSGQAARAGDLPACAVVDPVVDRDTHLRDRRSQQPRDVHLGDAHDARDLVLAQVVEEPQVDDAPLALRQRRGRDAQELQAVRARELLVGAAEAGDAALPGVIGLVERRGVVAARAEHGLDDPLLARVQALGEVGDRGRASEAAAQALALAADRRVQLLQVARHVHRPPVVAEVPADLAADVRLGEGPQLDAAREVEAVDRLQQADAADLHEVVQRLAAVGVAARDAAHERQHPLDQLLAGLAVAVVVVAVQQIGLGQRGWHRGHGAAPHSGGEAIVRPCDRPRKVDIVGHRRRATISASAERWTDPVTHRVSVAATAVRHPT